MKETTTGRWLSKCGALVVLVIGMFAPVWLSETVAAQEKSWKPLSAVWAQTLNQ